jgi:hypothetical protein
MVTSSFCSFDLANSLTRPKNVASRDGHLNHLRKVQSRAAGLLPDLLAATEAVRDQQHLLIRVAYTWKQHALSAFGRHLVVLFF